MPTLLLSIIIVFALCKYVDLQEAREFKKLHGYTRKDANQIARLMQDSSLPPYLDHKDHYSPEILGQHITEPEHGRN